jgi:hypothetical protein
MSQEKKSAGQKFAEKMAREQAAKAPASRAAVPVKKVQINASVAAVLMGGNQPAAAAPVRAQPTVGRLNANALGHMNFLGANQADNSAGANQSPAAPVVQGLDANRGNALAALFGGGAAPAPVSAPVAPSAPAVIDPNAPPPPPPPAFGAPIKSAPKTAAAASAPAKKTWATVIPAAPGEREVPPQHVVQQAVHSPVAAPAQQPSAASVMAAPVPPILPVAVAPTKVPQPLQVLPVAPRPLPLKPSMAAVAAQGLKAHANVQVFAPAPVTQPAVVVQQQVIPTMPVAPALPSAQSAVAPVSFFAPAPPVIVREKKNITTLLKEFESFATLQIGNPSSEDICEFLKLVNENPVNCHLKSAHKLTPEANIYRAASHQVVLCDELSKVVTEIMDPKWKKAGWSLKVVSGKRPEHIKVAQAIISKAADSFTSGLFLVADKPDAMTKAYNIALELRANFHEYKSSSKHKDYERWYKALDTALLNCKTPITDKEFDAALRKMIPNQLTQ